MKSARTVQRRARLWPAVGELPLYIATASVTTVLTALVLQLWNAARAVPFYYSSDALAVGAHFKTILDTGWYEREPALGAPFGQVYHDFPQADNLHMAAVAVMNLVVDSWAVALNAYYLLGFPLAALAALWFLRLLGVSRAMALVLAVLYALAPFHFERNQTHLFLASYYAVPLAAGIVVRSLRGIPLWHRGPGEVARPWLVTVLAMVLVGSASTYYAVFTALLLGVAGVVALWRDRHWRHLAGTAAAGAVLVVTMVANMAPDILHARGRDANTIILQRDAAGAEVYGLKPAQLLLPSRHHRWEPLRDLRLRYDETFPLPGESTALGLVAAAGLLLLVAALVSALVIRVPDDDGDAVMRQLALLGLVALGAAQIGGLSTFVALFVTENLRGWNRMTIFISCFSLGAVGLALDRLVRWACGRRPGDAALRIALPTILAAGVLGLGVWDQTGSASVPDYDAVRAVHASDADFVRAIEAQMPAGAVIFQMPHRVFPETPPVNGVLDTEQLRLYLSSTRTRWSAGGLKGRPQTDWPLGIAEKPIATMVPLLAIAGFSGITIDRKALGGTAFQVEADLAAAIATGPTALSRDARYAFWPIGDVAARMTSRLAASDIEKLRAATLLPPVVYAGSDFDGPVRSGGTTVWHARTQNPSLLLDNARDAPVQAHLSLSVTSPTGVKAVEIRLPGRDSIVLDLTGPPARVEVDLLLSPGRNPVQLRRADGVSGGEEAVFDVIDVRLEDPVIEGFRP